MVRWAGKPVTVPGLIPVSGNSVSCPRRGLGSDVPAAGARQPEPESPEKVYTTAVPTAGQPMSERTRRGAKVESGTLYLESEDDWIEIGSMDAVVELIGGEVYTLEYTDRQSAADWLPTDEDNTLTIDVREELADWGYTDEFVGNVAGSPLDETGESGHPVRTEVFVDMVTAIWDAKGNLEE